MCNTVTNIYDGGTLVGGNNLLTSNIRHIANTTATDYRTDFAYDWRNRQTGITQWIVNPGTGGTYVFTSKTLDNNGNLTQTQQFNSTTNTSTLTALIRQSNAFYDNLQRVPERSVGGSTWGRRRR